MFFIVFQTLFFVFLFWLVLLCITFWALGPPPPRRTLTHSIPLSIMCLKAFTRYTLQSTEAKALKAKVKTRLEHPVYNKLETHISGQQERVMSPFGYTVPLCKKTGLCEEKYKKE